MKLQTKIFLFLIPLIILPMSFMGGVAYKRLQSISQDALKNQMAASMASAGNKLRCKIASAQANIALYAQAEQLANFVLTDDEDQRYSMMLPPLLRLFSSYQQAFKDYIEIRVLTPDGYEDARFRTLKAENVSEYENESAFFKEISQSPQPIRTTFFRNPDTNQFNMIVSHKIRLRNTALNPVTRKPFLKGYLVLTISLDFLQEQIDEKKNGQNGILFYTDSSGKILFHPDKNLCDTRLTREYFFQLKNAAVNVHGIVPVRLEDDFICAKREKIHSDFYLFATLPGKEYHQAGKKQWAMVVSGTIILTLIIVLGAVFVIIKFQVLLPLNRLNTAVERLGSGRLDSKLIIGRKDEIGKLSMEFNAMVDKLRKITVSRDYVDAILESMNNSVLVISRNGRIKKANVGASGFTGYQKDQLVGKSILELFPDSNGDVFESISNGIRAVNLEKIITVKDGRQYPVLFSDSLMLFSNDMDDIICLIHDISDRIKTEQEKIEAHKIAAEQAKHALIGQVAGKMAHDFNNVLGIIMGNSELAMIDCRESEMKKTLELILDQTIRGRNLTKNLVAFAKIQEPRQEFFKLDEKINFVIRLLTKDLSQVEVILEGGTGELELLADSGMIEHALVNLIQNSIHSTSNVQCPQIIIRSYGLDDCVYIEIQDNGCGIPEMHLEDIYALSFSLKGSRDLTGSYDNNIKGTGYGLANVKKYIDQHKGSITVASEFGSGAKFTICLPVIRRELTPEERTIFVISTPHCNNAILLVEDEPSISDVQYRILSQEPFNHNVDIAQTGRMAMELFGTQTYDLVSLDYILSGKINGMDIYHHIRNTNKTIPVLFTSGNLEFLESIKELKQNDVNIDHVSKPCQNKEYVNSINRLLEKKYALFPEGLNISKGEFVDV